MQTAIIAGTSKEMFLALNGMELNSIANCINRLFERVTSQ